MAAPTAPIADAIAVYHRASLPVLDDPQVWAEEAQRTGARLLAWPRPCEGTQHARLRAILFNADVDVVLVLLHDKGDPLAPALPPDVHDPKMQVLLRVVQRSAEAGWAALQAAFGGMELTRRRDYINGTIEALADVAWRSGLPRGEAFAAVGINRRQGYRATDRAVTRKAKRPKL